MGKCKDIYSEPITKKYGNHTVTVQHPILTSEEYRRRFENFKREAVRLVLAAERVNNEKAKENNSKSSKVSDLHINFQHSWPDCSDCISINQHDSHDSPGEYSTGR